MKKLYCQISLLLLSMLILRNAMAQDCAQALRLARAIYDQGRLQEVETYLKPCFTGKAAGEQKTLLVEAYKLMCLSHIYLEEPEKADEDMLNIKRTDPYYRPNEGVDPAEYVALYKTFREKPVYRLGAVIGVNFSKPNILELNFATTPHSGSSYKTSIGLQFGAAVDFPVYLGKSKDRWNLHGELLIFQTRKFQLNQIESRVNPVTEEIKYNRLTGQESHASIAMPLAVQYQYASIKTLQPYISAGLVPEWLGTRDLILEKIRDDQPPVPERNYELKSNRLLLSALIAAGVNIPLRPGIVKAEFRYNHGLTHITNNNLAYQNNEITFDHGYADSVFSISSFAVCLSYLYEQFKPKKLARKK